MGEEQEENTTNGNVEGKRVKWFKWIVAVALIPILASLIPEMTKKKKLDSLNFTFSKGKPFFQPDSDISVSCDDSHCRENKNTKATIILNGFRFEKSAKPISNQSKAEWKFNLSEYNIPKNELTLELEKRKSYPLQMYISAKKPYLQGRVGKQGPNYQLAGFAAREGTGEVKIEIYFYHDGETKRIPVELIKSYDEGSHTSVFRFDKKIENIFSLSKDSLSYNQVFFELRATDEYGNHVSLKKTYENFMSQGEEIFEIGNLEVNLSSIYSPNSVSLSMELTKNNTDDPEIQLNVVMVSINRRVLNWQTKIPDSEAIFLIFKDGEKVGETKEHTWESYAPGIASFKVEQFGPEGFFYSNSVNIKKDCYTLR